MKVLFVTRSYLFQNNGGANASKAYIKAFSLIYKNLTIVYPENVSGQSDQFIPEDVNKIPCPDTRSNIVKGLDVYRGRLHRFYVPVRRIINKEDFDIVIFDNSITSLGLMKYAKRKGCKIITIHHNVEMEYLKDNPVSILYSLPYKHYVKKAEKVALLNSSLNFTLTKDDADTFSKMNPKHNLHLYKIGVFEFSNTVFRLANKPNCLDLSGNMVFVISGSLYFKQSEKPIVDFLKYYYPMLKERYPMTKLIITGRNPSQQLSDTVLRAKDVELVPNPDNIYEVISRADYYICPINAGGGLKLRVMDGLKQGLAAVVHKVSSRGYEDLIEKKILFEYGDTKTFLYAIDSLISSQVSSRTVYEAYLQNFSLETGINRIKTALKCENLQ